MRLGCLIRFRFSHRLSSQLTANVKKTLETRFVAKIYLFVSRYSSTVPFAQHSGSRTAIPQAKDIEQVQCPLFCFCRYDRVNVNAKDKSNEEFSIQISIRKWSPFDGLLDQTHSPVGILHSDIPQELPEFPFFIRWNPNIGELRDEILYFGYVIICAGSDV